MLITIFFILVAVSIYFSWIERKQIEKRQGELQKEIEKITKELETDKAKEKKLKDKLVDEVEI